MAVVLKWYYSVCKWWMLSVYVPDGFSFHSLQQWVLWRQADNSERCCSWNWLKIRDACRSGLIQTDCRAKGWSDRKGDRGIETDKKERENAVTQSWEQIGLKVTTPSMRWFFTEGNGAWVLSHKKQFIAILWSERNRVLLSVKYFRQQMMLCQACRFLPEAHYILCWKKGC